MIKKCKVFGIVWIVVRFKVMFYLDNFFGKEFWKND